MSITLDKILSPGLCVVSPALTVLVLSTGCSAPADSFEPELGQITQAARDLDNDPDYEVGDQVSSKRLKVKDISRPDDEGYIADVIASGTGCPSADSWSADVAPDGQAFTVVFNQYEIELSPGTPKEKRVCRISLLLNSNRRRGFALGSFAFAGYAYLEDGMKATSEASYKFKNKAESRAQGLGHVLSPLELTGPYDNEYLLQNTVTSDMFPPGHRCDKERALVIATRLEVRNNPRKSGSAYLNTSSADGTVAFDSAKGVLKFRILNKDCDRGRR